LSDFDTADVRQSVMEALAKLDELKHSIDVLQAQIKSDFERKMELFRFSQVRREFLEPFFEEPQPMRVLCVYCQGALTDGRIFRQRKGMWVPGVSCYSCKFNRLRKQK